MKRLVAILAVLSLSGCSSFVEAVKENQRRGEAFMQLTPGTPGAGSNHHIIQTPNAQYTVRTRGTMTTVYRSGGGSKR